MADAPRVRNESIKIGLVTVIAAWVGSHLGLLLWWLVRQPVLWVAGVTGYAGWRLWDGSGPWSLALAGGVVAAGLIGWRLGHPSSFRPVVAWPLRRGRVACSCIGGTGTR